MPQIKFTDRKIASLKPPKTGQVDYFDTTMPGFGIRVSYGGAKAWFVKYVHKGRQRRMTLGQYPAVKLAKARELTLDAKHELTVEKHDPALQKRADRQALTFKELADLYVEEYAVKKRSGGEDKRILNKYFAPWHPRKAVEIERAEIVERLQEIKKENGPIMANRCLACVRKVYSWALRNAKLPLPFNPALRLDAPGEETTRDRVYTDEEIKSLWEAFGDFGISGAVFKMILITGQRPGEVAGMEWKEIDGNLWTIPGARTKNKRVHVVPLNDMALEELNQAPRLHEHWVFPSPKGKDQPITNTGKAVRGAYGKKKSGRSIRDSSKVNDFTPHDLRRTLSTGLTKLGFSRFIVDRLLNHVEPGVGGVYDRYDYRKEKTEAAEAWGRHLEGIVGDSGNVVQLLPKRG
ncbi:MAG: tyrosine-type recombinase/integrase [Proteobacteria bacterium]|nr:tyrosine-type recombinase/integrase [Pseudomonadota bacterium]